MSRIYARSLVYGLLALMLLAAMPVLAVPPTNNSLSQALSLNLPAFGAVADIDEATLQAGEPTASCAVDGNDKQSVWFIIGAPAGTLQFETTTNSADYDTVITLYKRPEFNLFGGLVEIACAVKPGSAATLKTALAGGQYLVRVASDDTAAPGTRTLNYSVTFAPPVPSPVPANDEIANARPVVFNKASKVPNWQYATDNASDPLPSCMTGSVAGSTLWYTFTGSGSNTLISVEGSLAGTDTNSYSFSNPGVAIYTGSPGSLIEAGCDEDSGHQDSGRITMVGSAGVQYHVMVFNDTAAGFLGAPSTAKLLVAPEEFDLVNNGDFDSGLDGWTVSNATNDGIASDSGTPFSNSAFRFTGGPGENSQLKQTMTVPASLFIPANTTLRFVYAHRSQTALPPQQSIKFEFKLIYADGSVVKLKVFHSNIDSTGSSAFPNYDFLITRKAPVKIKFAIKHTATSGDIAIDSIRVRIAANEVRRSVPSGLLPLPAAPGGR